MCDRGAAKIFFNLAAIAAVILGLYLSSLHSYLLFHSLVEITTIAISFTLFILAWNARRFLANDTLKLMGIGYAFIAIVDLLHTLSYKGMDVFPGYGANLPTQLWIAARYLQAATLCVAPMFARRRISEYSLFAGYFVTVAVIALLVYSGNFPDCFVEGQGLTAFKVTSEYVITAMLLISLLLFHGIRATLSGRVFSLIVSSIVCTAVSEVSFTTYLSVHGFANMVGHLLKLASFYLIYRALLVTGFKEPYELIFRDLTQVKESLRKAHGTLEEKVKERTAELRAINDCNQILVRAEDEQTLLHDVCRIVCDKGGYRMAWVGYAENDDARTICPVAWAGIEEGYLEHACRTWADTKRGSGPSGVAIRTGKADCIQDFATEPRAVPWREMALQRGYRSSIALPLKGEHEDTFGALSIYSSETNAFTPDEIKLMEKLAGDLSFGITVLRARIERKRAERELRESEEKVSAVFHATPDMIAVTRMADGEILEVNEAFTQLLGYTRAESIGRSTSELSIWADPADRAAFIAKLEATGQINEFETTLRRKDGSLITCMDTARIIDFGDEACILSIVRDITERKRNECVNAARLRLLQFAATHTLDELLQATLDEAEALSGSLIGFYHFLEADQKTLLLQNWSTRTKGEFCKAEGAGLHYDVAAAGVWVDCIHERRAVVHNDYASLPHRKGMPQGHAPVTRELLVPVFRGENIMAILGVGNKPHDYTEQDVEVVSLLADLAWEIAERKRAEQEVGHLKNYLANIIDSMPSMVVGVDQGGRVTQWNLPAEAATGIPTAGALGRPLGELMPDFSPWIEQLRSQITQQRPASREKLLVEKDGERHFYDLMLYPLITAGAEGAVVRIDDVTERTRIQELMVQTEKMMSVGGLAAGMAHEINNPLGIITQAAQNIERRVSPELPANRQAAEAMGVSMELLGAYLEQRQVPLFIDSIREAAARASRIIANMLRFSRRADSAMTFASLAAIMDQTVELAANDYDLKKKYDFRRIEIVRDYEADAPSVPMIPTEIEQVLLNLLKNAAQAMMGNPPERKPRLVLRLRQEERYGVAEVEDNGPGMPEDVRRRVFEPFFTTKEPGFGTGLGLSVAYMIVTQNHKGLMEVASTPGNGARFTVRLPLAKEDTHE